MLHRPSNGAEESPPKELLATLSRKGLVVCICRSVYDAMAEVALHHRRVVLGLTRKPMAVMFVDPAQIPGAVALYRAIERYAPHAACWRYSRTTKPRLAVYKPSAGSEKSEEDSFEEAPETQNKPRGEPGRIASALSALTGKGTQKGSTPGEADPFATGEPARPRLRLAGDPGTSPSARHVDRANQHPPQREEPELDIRVGEPRPLSDAPAEARPRRTHRATEEPELPGDSVAGGSSMGPMLSDEELSILLWDTWYPERGEG